MNKIKQSYFHIVSYIFPISFGLYTLNKIQTAGFPDGHVTAYETAYKIPGIIFILFDIGFCIFYFFKNKSQNKNYIFIYLFLRILAILILDWYLKSFLNLNYGQGG